MKFTRARSALGLLAMLSACSVSPPDDRTADRPGSGVVEAVPPAQTPMESPAPVATPAPVPTPAPAPEPPETRYRPGIGTVESASIVSLPSQSAAGGGATGPTMAYRLRMPDGTMQSVVQAGERFEVGDRVEITRDGRLMRR